MIIEAVSSLRLSFEIFPTAESVRRRAKAVNSVLPEVSISGKYTTANGSPYWGYLSPSTSTDDRGMVLMEASY
jgi:hypothetical protein